MGVAEWQGIILNFSLVCFMMGVLHIVTDVDTTYRTYIRLLLLSAEMKSIGTPEARMIADALDKMSDREKDRALNRYWIIRTIQRMKDRKAIHQEADRIINTPVES